MGLRALAEVLSLGKIGGGQAGGPTAAYYTSSVATGRDDYYTGKGEAAGEWFGAGAEGLGLAGEVDADDFQALVMDARDPRSQEPLRGVATRNAVRGIDMTFSAPKTASLLFFIGDECARAAIKQAHGEAVGAALGYMERNACLVRLGHAGAGGKEAAEGFAGAVFRHRTSRAGDPHLHSHAVVANLARRPSDGKYLALDTAAIYEQAKTGGYVYQAELRARLTAYLGVEWGAVKNGMAEIRGFPPAVIKHFSKRRVQIVEELETRRSESPRAAQAAALETRGRKQAIHLEQLRGEVRAVAAEFGLGRDQLDELLGRVERRPQLDRKGLAALAERLTGSAGLTRRASTFDRRAVVQQFCAGHTYGVTVERVEHLADRFLASAHVVQLEGESAVVGPDTLRRRDGSLVVRTVGAKFTTPDLLRLESATVQIALGRRGEGAGQAAEDTVARTLAGRLGLTADQVAMVHSLTRSGDGVEVVRAAAGTGKTYALDVAREAWAASGLRVVGATLSARAACELRDAGGIESSTIARLLMDLDRGYGFVAHNVVVVDEAAMVGTRDLHRLIEEAAKAGAKVVLVGDDHQLPEIDAGGTFRGLADRLGASELTTVMRHRDQADRVAIAELRDGRPAEWIAQADRRGLVVAERGHEAQFARLVSDWYQGLDEVGEGEESMMFAPTRDAAGELNVRAQAYMRHAGRLGDHALQVGETSFSEGDRVMCLANRQRDLGVLNGLRGTVTAIEPETYSLRVKLDRAHEVVLPASYIEDGNVALGYAITVHKSQGMTCERAYVLGSEDLYRELAYTALSRHRESCRFYLNAGEPAGSQLELEVAGEARDQVLERAARVMGRERAQELALDVHERDEALRALPDAGLAARAGRLEQLLGTFPAEARAAQAQPNEVARQARRLADDDLRLAASRQEREDLGRLDRRERAELDARIARQVALVADARTRHDRLAAEVQVAESVGDAWLQQHGVELAEASAIERELATRRARLHAEAVIRAAHDPASDLHEQLAPRPDSLLDGELWDNATAAAEDYRSRHGQLPGPERPDSPGTGEGWSAARQAANGLTPARAFGVERDCGPDDRDEPAPDLGAGPER